MLVQYLILCLHIIGMSSLNAIQLEKQAAIYVKNLVDEFKENLASRSFDNIIPLMRTGRNIEDIFYPQIFIWCPIDHYGLEVTCPVHGCVLKTGCFTDQDEKKSPRNPLIGYDLFRNVLVIQRHYIYCHKGISRRYLSASGAIMKAIPQMYSIGCFPLVMFHRSTCTKKLVDFSETQLPQGVNFIKICEGIAAINFNDYQQRIEGFIYSSSAQALPNMLDLNEQFYANELYSFPRNYKLTDMCSRHDSHFLRSYFQDK